MTRLLTLGWETNDLNEGPVAGGTVAATQQSLITSAPTPPSPGIYAIKFNDTSGSDQVFRTWTLASNPQEIWTRFNFYAHWTSTAQNEVICFLDSGGVQQGTITYSGNDHLLRARLGDFGSILGTSSLTMSIDAWHLVEVHWKCSSSVGVIEIWVDSTRVLNATGLNSMSTSNGIQRYRLGYQTNGMVANNYSIYDDWAVNDTNGSINNGQIGDGRVVLLKPSGAGSNTNMSRGGTDTGANYSQTNELPPSMTQYVYSSTAGTRDTYALADVPAGSWTVNCAEIVALAAIDVPGSGSLGLTLKSGTTTNEGTAQALATATQYFRQLYETDPNTSAAWTVTAINAAEAGATAR